MRVRKIFGHAPYLKSCACVIVHRAGLERSVRKLIVFCVQGSYIETKLGYVNTG